MTSGDYEGNKYSAGVKIKTTNLEEVNDPDLGLKDIETHIWVKIPCSSNAEANELNRYIRDVKATGEILHLKTTIPRQGDSDTYTCSSVSTASELLKNNEVKKEPTDFAKGLDPKKK